MGVVRKDWASQNSIALSWPEAEKLPSEIVDYEVKYFEKVKSLIVLNVTVGLVFFDHFDMMFVLIASALRGAPRCCV